MDIGGQLFCTSDWKVILNLWNTVQMKVQLITGDENEQWFVTTNEPWVIDLLKDPSKWSNSSSIPVIILPHNDLFHEAEQNVCKSS